MKTPLTLLMLSISIAVAFAAPEPPSDVVFKPTFLTGYDSLTAGTGFIARFKEEFVFVTAHHLFGPAAGLEHDLSPPEAKQFAVALVGSSMNRTSLVVTSSEMLLIPSAKAFDNKDSGHDVAAYRLSGYHGPSLLVSDTPPKKGEGVYLLARPRGEEKLRLIRAEVSRVGNDGLEYFYAESGVNFAGTSGAPVLNERGMVVGINLGGGELKGKTFGFANPAGAFAPLVSSALKANPALEPVPGAVAPPAVQEPHRP